MRLIAIAVLAIGAAALAYRTGDGTVDRLPNHDGYFLVEAEDIEFDRPRRPRHTVVVVVDGLRRDVAEELQSIARIRERGQCRRTHNGALTVSRPIYTVLSSGLEADRTGARNNDLTTPVSVDSIWQRARDAGLTVSGFSELSWWQQLFPNGFSDYVSDDRVSTNLFAIATLSDLTLIHPVYVDYAGHEKGASSVMYEQASARVDRELLAFLERLDFSRDLLVVTADHGHTASGGHGGPEPVVSQVLTCFAGVGVQRQADTSASFDLRSLAPTLAVLLGVPFPAHMRAGADSLDEIFTVASADLGASYLAQRRDGIEAFRAANQEKLSTWLGGTGNWPALYLRERRAQQLRALFAFAPLLLVLFAIARFSKVGIRRLLLYVLWGAATVAGAGLLYSLVRGGFGWNSINARAEFIRAALLTGLAAMTVGAAIHGVLWRSAENAAAGLCALAVIGAYAGLAHVVVYGNPLGFPIPSDVEMFLPFFLPALTISAALACLATCGVAGVRAAARSRRS